MRWAAGLAALVLACAALVWLFGIGTPGMMNFPRPFHSEKWKAAKAWSYERCAMVGDLRHRIGLTGRTVPEVLAMLGEDIDKSAGPPRAYGLCPSVSDYYILEIEWRNGRVASTVVRDT